MRVLAGDIGGTNVRLHVADVNNGVIGSVAAARFESARYATFEQLLREFLAIPAAAGSPTAVCLAVAGPIRRTASGQAVRVTNLPWEVDGGTLARDFEFPRVRLINDFQAVGYGIEALTDADLVVLQQGEPEPRGVRAVLGAGTGLGQAILVWQQNRYEACPTEGGHVDFAPTDNAQIELWRYLNERYGRATYERVLSGPGLVDTYAFLRGHGQPDETGTGGAGGRTTPAAITRAALSGADPLAVQALDLFVRVYGAQAGNLALTVLPRGGVYLAGGIAPKIIDKLRDGSFLRAFQAKGRLATLLQRVPISVVMNENVGLLGATLAAVR
jgi:glucokinase